MTRGSLFIRILEYRGLVARAQLTEARARQAQLAKGGHTRDLGTVLVAMGALNKQQLDEVVGGKAAKIRCIKCGAVPTDQRVAPQGWPACGACEGRLDVAPGSTRLEAATPGDPTAGMDPLAATLELGLSASDMATMKGKTPDLVVPVSTKPTPAHLPPAPHPALIGPPRPPKTGDVLGGCRIERKLGQGGMGAVYLATHLMLDKPVAIKILDPRLMNSKEVIGRFQLEARAAAKLDHPNIVRVLNVGAESGLYFMTQEFVQGESLMELLKRRGPLEPRKAAAVIREIAHGLAAAHNDGVVHRDIKPGNVMMTHSGNVKVADFGLAKEMHSDAELSHAGQVLGSPHYLSPEQGAGLPVDHRTDLYALGVTYFFLLCGKRPFDGATPIAVIFKHINEAPPKVTKFAPNTPPGHVAIVSKCLKKDPDDRYPDAETLIADLDAVISGRSPKAADGTGGLSTVRDKPVPKPLTARYTKEQHEKRADSHAEITDQAGLPDRLASKRRRQRDRDQAADGDGGTEKRKGPGVLGKLLRLVVALIVLAGLAAGAFWIWKPAQAQEYWNVARARVSEWTGLETNEDRAAAALAHAQQVAASMGPEKAADVYAAVATQYPSTVAAVQATKRASELRDDAAWNEADGESQRLEESGQLRAARATLQGFLATHAGATQSAQANRRIEALSAAIAADTAARESAAKTVLAPLQARIDAATDPLHREVFPAFVGELRDLATRYSGAESASLAAAAATELEEARANEIDTSLQSLRRQVAEVLDPATEFAAITAACQDWLSRFGDDANAAQVDALLADARERREAALQTESWKSRLAKLEELFAASPDAWRAILTEAEALRTKQTDPDIAAAAAKIERITQRNFAARANAKKELVRAKASEHSDRGDLLSALRALGEYDLELFGDADAAVEVRAEVERLTRAIDRQLRDPLEWIAGSNADDLRRARHAAERAASRYAGSAYAARATAMRDQVVAAADAQSAAWMQEGATLAAAGKLAEAIPLYNLAAEAGNATQRTSAATTSVELSGRGMLQITRTHLAAKQWDAAQRKAVQILQQPLLKPIHGTARLLQRHAAALADDMVYVSGAMLPRTGGGQTVVPPFYIDRLEVSAAAWLPFVTSNGYITDRFWELEGVDLDDATRERNRTARLQHYLDRTGKIGPRYWLDSEPPEGLENHPVRGITWFEAAAYAKYRGKQLPSGFQWMAAAGWDPAAQKLRAYPWGDDWDAAKAYAGVDETNAPTTAVDSLPDGASPAGCLHMAGNVREWTADWFDPFKKSERLVVGCGAYSLDAPAEAQVTARHAKAPYNAGDDVGLRLVLPAPTLAQLGLSK